LQTELQTLSAFKIATWNVNSLRVRWEQVSQWLRQEKPDILALQETKTTDAAFPEKEVAALGYCAVFHGQPAYNGVATLSRTPAARASGGIPGYDDPQRRVLCSWYEQQRIGVLNLYVPNGAEVGAEKYRYKLDWLDRVIEYAARLTAQDRWIVLGDLNIAPEDRDVHDPALWADRILVSEPERLRFRQLLQRGQLQDCFRSFEQEANSFSWWDYRGGSFRRNRGLRIDHILANRAWAAHCRECRIDKAPRGWERPSDHAPVVAVFEQK